MNEIRTLTIEGEPWFVGKDVAGVLGYSNTKKAIADHVDDEDKLQGDGVTIRDPIGREQHPTIINESGLLIRKTGHYGTMSNPFCHVEAVSSSPIHPIRIHPMQRALK